MTAGQRRVRFVSRRLLTAAFVVALSFSAGSVFVASGDEASPTFYGCLKSSNGTLYEVNTSEQVQCKQNDTPITWNQDGPQGLQGPAGPQGEQGIAGPQGAQGPMGPQGEPGVPGADGVDGVDGADGATGPQGPQGEQGPIGPAGPQGLVGPQGPTGATGPQGSSGMADLEWVTESRTYGPLEYFTILDANCPAGKIAISGGFAKDYYAQVLMSRPILNNANIATGWRVHAEMPAFQVHAEWTTVAYVLCANAS